MNKEIYKLIIALFGIIGPIITRETGIEFGKGDVQQYAESIATIVGLIILFYTRHETVQEQAKKMVRRGEKGLFILTISVFLAAGSMTSFIGCKTINEVMRSPLGNIAVKAIPVLVLEANPALAPYVQLLGGIMRRMEAAETPEQLSAEFMTELEDYAQLTQGGKIILQEMTDSIARVLTDFFREQQGRLLEADKQRIIEEIGITLEIIGQAYSTDSAAGASVAVEREIQLSGGILTIE